MNAIFFCGCFFRLFWCFCGFGGGGRFCGFVCVFLFFRALARTEICFFGGGVSKTGNSRSEFFGVPRTDRPPCAPTKKRQKSDNR